MFMNLKNIIKTVILASLVIFCPCLVCSALPPAPVDTGTPSVYKVTVKKFRISSDGGTTWATIKDESVEFDIASADVGAAVGSFFAGTFQPGTYNMIEHTPGATFKIKGYIIDGVSTTDYYTSTTAANGTASTTSFDPDNPPSDYGEATITAYGYSEGDSLPAETQAVDIVIKKGANQKINIDFEVSNTLALYNTGPSTYQLMPAQPSASISVE